MKNLMKSSLIALAALLTLSSCSSKLRYFTEDLYSEYQWTDDELERIQFYVSEDIILRKKYSGENARISDGKIKVVDGSKVEEVIIEAGTPGVFVHSPKRGRFAISFDSRDESKYLMFGPNPKANGKFVLLAKDWDRRWGKITYGDQTYETSSASAYAALMVDIKHAKKVNVKSSRARGNTVN